MPLARRRTLHRHARRQHALLEPLAEVAEGVVPFHAMVDARQLVLRVRRVHVHEPEAGELERHDAPLGVQVIAAQAVQHLQRLLFAEHGRARIALPFGVAPILVVLRQVERGLALLQLRLLQRHDVGVEVAHDVLEALLEYGAQAVDVPRDEAHRFLLRRLAAAFGSRRVALSIAKTRARGRQATGSGRHPARAIPGGGPESGGG